jgi:hypothetical protein
MGYRRLKPLCAAASVGLRFEARAAVAAPDRIGRDEGALRDHFRSRGKASKTPCASRDPYPKPDSSLLHLRMQRDDPSVFDPAVGDCEHAVPEAPQTGS